MISTFLFDATYHVLSFLIVGLLATTVVFATLSRIKARKIALGTAFSALGALVTIVESLALTALTRSSSINGFLYQQLQFSIAYVGFALFLFGIDKGLLSTQFKEQSLKRSRILMCCSFLILVVVSSLFLFNDGTYKVTVVGSQTHVAQQTVFWFPLFLALGIGTVISFFIALRKNGVDLGRYPMWFGLCSLLIFVGTLRESTIIPSSGDPLTDLLVAFLPFVSGSTCILVALLTLRRSTENLKVNAIAAPTKY